jgi:hypothetical protein
VPKKAKAKSGIGCWGFALITFLIFLAIGYLAPADSDSSDSVPETNTTLGEERQQTVPEPDLLDSAPGVVILLANGKIFD